MKMRKNILKIKICSVLKTLSEKYQNIICDKYDYLIFKLKFFIKHNKSVVAIWILFLLFLLYDYKNNDQIQIIHDIIYVLPSLIALNGLLYVSFSHNLRNGSYDEEIKLLFELMDEIVEIIQRVQRERQPDLFNHPLMIEIYQKKFQNKNHFLLGAVEQHNLIHYLTSLLNSPKSVYLSSEINKEISELNTKNFNIITSKINHLKNLSINNIKIENSAYILIKKDKIMAQKYQGYLVPILTFKQFFNEEELKKLKLAGLDISKCADEDVIMFNIDEDSFKEINTLIYEIYSLAYKKIKKISLVSKF